MIKGIGTDIVDVDRMTFDLMKRVLSLPEQEKYHAFNAESRKAEFLAGRFAIKEAISKALGSIDFPLSLNELIVLNDENGRPYLICEKLKNQRFHLSISHERHYAVGFCVIEEADL